MRSAIRWLRGFSVGHGDDEREKSLPFVRSEEQRVDGDCTCVRMGIAGMTTERIKGRNTFEKPRGFQMSVTSGMSR
jgi:hypothetical protein